MLVSSKHDGRVGFWIIDNAFEAGRIQEDGGHGGGGKWRLVDCPGRPLP